MHSALNFVGLTKFISLSKPIQQPPYIKPYNPIIYWNKIHKSLSDNSKTKAMIAIILRWDPYEFLAAILDRGTGKIFMLQRFYKHTSILAGLSDCDAFCAQTIY